MSGTYLIPQASEDPRVVFSQIEEALSAPLPDSTKDPVAEAAELALKLAAEFGLHSWNLQQLGIVDPLAVVESRRPIVGTAFTFFQRLVRKLTGWFLAPQANQITQFHLEAIEAFRAMQALHAHQISSPAANPPLAQLQAEMAQLTASQRAVQDNLLNRDRILSRIDRLEKLVQALRLDRGEAERRQFGAPAGGEGAAAEMNYAAFQARFRGSETSVTERQAELLADYEGAAGPILDIGCGRGEFLELLAGRGFDAYGIDENQAQIVHCNAEGMTAFHDDALSHLAGLPDQHLGGIHAGHVVEHLPGNQRWQLLRLAALKLRSNGTLIIEAPNPRVLAVSATTFWLDPTHVSPVHPDTLSFWLGQLGFQKIDIRYCAPFPPEDQLARVSTTRHGNAEWATEMNDLIDRLNQLLLGDRDFVLIAHR